MDIKTYIKEASRTSAVLDTKWQDEMHYVMGMVTEVGELMDVYKKELAYDKPMDVINMAEEIGDLMWYIANYCRVMGFDFEEILEKNIAKLKARYPEKFTADKANHRDLEKERKILEQ